jgi:hypothetical protein
MSKTLILIAPLVLAAVYTSSAAQQVPPAQTEQKPPRPAAPRLTPAETIRRHLQKLGASVDDAKSSADMIVSNYLDPRGGKITIVIVNDKRKGFLGFYIYNFGSLKNVDGREQIYKYLLGANDAITIGSFFVDGEDDIGYKYLVPAAQGLNQAVFETAYLTMATVARERKPDIRQMLAR